MIYEIVERTGVGFVLSIKGREPNANPQKRWVVQGKVQANLFREMVEREKMCFMTKKAVEWEIWDQALTYWNTSQNRASHHTQFDWGPMAELRDELIMRRTYQDSPPNLRYLHYLSPSPSI
jgi:hypothetical protein